MKFFTLFAAGAMAASVVKRDVDQVISDIKAIQSATESLDSAINAITGPESKDSVLSANQKVLDAIATATSDANDLPTLTLAQALEFSAPVSSLGDSVTKAVNDLISKKSTITSAGLGGTTEQQLLAQQKAAQTFSDTLTSKVPEAAAPIAQGLSAPILSALQKGVDAFKGLSDSGSGSGSSSSAAASSSASAPASSSAPAESSSAPASSASVPASGYATSTSAPTYSTGAPSTNGTAPSYSAPAPYTGGAGINVAGFGGLAVAALVAAF